MHSRDNMTHMTSVCFYPDVYCKKCTMHRLHHIHSISFT